MSHYATLRDYQFKDRADDIRGTTLYGVNGDKLGTIDDVIFEHGSGAVKYCVVDTGGWLSSHKFLVPAERIHSYDQDRDALQVDLLKEHIERYFPAYDEKNMERDEDWRDYEGRYSRAATDNRVWNDGPVLHREGSSRTITPDDVQFEDGAAEVTGADVTPSRLAGRFPSTMPGAGKIDMVPKGARPVERTMSAGNEAFVPPEGEQSFEATRQFGDVDVSVSHDPAGGNIEEGGVHDRGLHHRHAEGKVEEISSSPSFRPAQVTPPAPLGSMGEDIEPIAQPNVTRTTEPVVEVGSSRGIEPVNTRDSITIPESADTGDVHRLQDRNMNRVEHPVDDVRGTGRVGVSSEDMHSRPERWRRFEDLLRKNRVDIEAKCAQCAPARDRKVS